MPVFVPWEPEAAQTASDKGFPVKIKQYGGRDEEWHRKHLFPWQPDFLVSKFSWSLQHQNLSGCVFVQAVINCWLGQDPKVAISSEEKVRWTWYFGSLRIKSYSIPRFSVEDISEISKMSSDLILYCLGTLNFSTSLFTLVLWTRHPEIP